MNIESLRGIRGIAHHLHAKKVKKLIKIPPYQSFFFRRALSNEAFWMKSITFEAIIGSFTQVSIYYAYEKILV